MGIGHRTRTGWLRWRRGHEPNVEYGWHCLTCGVDESVYSVERAEEFAAAHMREKGSYRKEGKE